MSVTRAWEYLVGTIYGGVSCQFIERGHVNYKCKRIPLRINDGELVYPGAHFTRLGGSKTSGGFTTIKMDEGRSLRYRGKISTLEGTLVVFDEVPRKDRPLVPCYWSIWDEEHETLLHVNRAGVSRIVELSECIVSRYA